MAYRGKSDIRAAKYEYRNISISICPQLKGGRAITFGPPGLPLIPNPFALSGGDKTNFTVALTIDSKEHTTKIDFSKIRIIIDDQTNITPISVVTKSEGRIINIESDIIITDKTISYDLQFAYPKDRINDLVIELGSIKINGETVYLPTLKYKNATHLDFFPLVITS